MIARMMNYNFINGFKWGEIALIKKVSYSTGLNVKWSNPTTLNTSKSILLKI
jgi:hypothetical protein